MCFNVQKHVTLEHLIVIEPIIVVTWSIPLMLIRIDVLYSGLAVCPITNIANRLHPQFTAPLCFIFRNVNARRNNIASSDILCDP